MDRKKKIILISIIILLVIIILLIGWFWFNKKPAEIIQPPIDQVEITPTVGQFEALPPPSESRVKSEKDYPLGLESLTSSFAERFVSYSSDANFKNLEDLKILSTAKMQAYLDDLTETSLIGQNGFEAQQAKALNNQIIYLNQDKAMVVVSLQLIKTQGEQAETTIDYPKLELSVVKSGSNWLIDEVKWQ